MWDIFQILSYCDYRSMFPFRAHDNATITHTMKIIINWGVSGQYHIFRDAECSQSQLYTVTEN